MTAFDLISNNLPVLILAAGIVASYATLRTQNNNQERRLSTVEGRVDAFNPIFLQIQKDLVAIQTSLKFMEQKIDRLDGRVKQSL